MVAGDIKTDDLNNFRDKSFLIDASGNLETEKGVKDTNKIDKFLNTVHNISS
jgi:phosphoribosylanthranilate isomerase